MPEHEDQWGEQVRGVLCENEEGPVLHLQEAAAPPILADQITAQECGSLLPDKPIFLRG